MPDPRCYIAGDVVLDFGTVNKGDSIGNSARQSVDLICELDANVSLNDASGKKGVIDLKWGKAITTINGGALPKQVKATRGTTRISIEAQIAGVPNETGDFSGSYSLIVGYY
ncbi:hypothetical protein [Serratia quinivorans]|uniref:hypothetical protein n=1 Tax=Serratia quinivorans TaxID=137545 RepID=UPI0039829CFB